MADYAFTPAAVLSSGAAQSAIAGEAIDAGEFIHLDTADGNKAKLAECGSTEVKAKVAGIALNSAAAGQPVSYVSTGEVTVDAATFAGTALLLVLSATAGKCAPAADLVGTNYLSVIGWSTAANKLRLNLANSALQLS